MLATALTMVPLAANAGTECRATMAAFQAIRSNMSYAQAVQVIGCPGEVISSSSIAGYITIMYMWDGNRFGANMNAMFQNDRLVNKAQFGLK